MKPVTRLLAVVNLFVDKFRTPVDVMSVYKVPVNSLPTAVAEVYPISTE